MTAVRFHTCLQWMVGLLKDQSLACEDDYQAIERQLHTQNSHVSSHTIRALCAPPLYWALYQTLVSGGGQSLLADDTSSFWPLIQSLARHGIYLVKSDDSTVNHSALSCVNPFDEDAHCTLMEGLMKLHADIKAPTNVIAKEIRHLFGLSSSKELPFSVEEALLLWLNKASRAAFSRHQRLCQEILQEDNPTKKREARLRLAREGGGRVEYCRRAVSISDLCDGQCLAATLIYYRPGVVSWKDFVFSRQLLTPDDSLSNLRAISRHCNRFLPQPRLHILPEHWVTHQLKPHILSFLSLLFHTMTKINKEELKVTSTASVPLLSRETIVNRTPRIIPTEHTVNSSVIARPVLSGLVNSTSKPPPTTESIAQPSSQSTTPFQPDTQLHSMSLPCVTTGPSGIAGPHNINRPQAHRLLFPPVVRNPSSLSQTNLLNSFTPDIASKPFRQLTTTKAAFESRSLISIAVERLGLQEQMKSKQCARSMEQLHLDIVNDRPFDSSTPINITTAEVDSIVDQELPHCNDTDNGIKNETGRNGNEAEGVDNEYNKSPPYKEIDKIESAETNGTDSEPSNGYATCPLPDQGPSQYHSLEDQIPENKSILEPATDVSVTQSNGCSNGIREEKEDQREREDRITLSLFPDKDFLPLPITLMMEMREGTTCMLLRAKARRNMHKMEIKLREKRLVRRDQQKMQFIIGRDLTSSVSPQKQSTSPPNTRTNQMSPLNDGKQLQFENDSSHSIHVPDHQIQTAQSCKPSTVPIQQPVASLRSSSSTTNNARPKSKTSRPISIRGNSRPGSSNSRPGSSNSRPGSSNSRPGSSNSRPGSSNSRPGSSNSRPGSSNSRLYTTDTRPSVLTSRPNSRLASDNVLLEADRKEKRKDEIRHRLEERDRERRRLAKARKIKPLPEDAPIINSQPSSSVLNKTRPINSAVSKTILPPTYHHNIRRQVSAGQNKSNKKLMYNALCFVCLAGEANITIKQKALTALESSTASHFFILFRDTLGLKFKALYCLIAEESKIVKIFGIGPKKITEEMVKQFFKYNSGTKCFQAVVTYSFSISMDALTIQDHYWSSATHRRAAV